MIDAQLKRGILNICILQLLRNENKYGYELIKIMQKYFDDTDESTLYAVLRRLNKEGLTDMYYSDISNGPVRKYYTITKLGKEYLSVYIDSWKYIENVFTQLGVL